MRVHVAKFPRPIDAVSSARKLPGDPDRRERMSSTIVLLEANGLGIGNDRSRAAATVMERIVTRHEDSADSDA